MVWPKLLLVDLQRPLEEGLCLVDVALVSGDLCQPHEGIGPLEMVSGGLLFPHGQGASIDRLRLCVLALAGVDLCQPHEGIGQEGMIWSLLLLEKAQPPLKKRFRLGVAAMRGVRHSQRSQGRQRVWMVRFQLGFTDA